MMRRTFPATVRHKPSMIGAFSRGARMRMDAEAVEALELIYAFIDGIIDPTTKTMREIYPSRTLLRRYARSHIAMQCHQQAIKDAATPQRPTEEPSRSRPTRLC